MQVIGDYARKIRVPTPMFNATKGIYVKAMKSGLGARYRRGLRGAGEDGEGQATQTRGMTALASTVHGRACPGHRRCCKILGKHEAGGGRDGVVAATNGSPRRHADRLDVPITMDDGLVLRADVFRPVKDGQYPVILTYGPYAKNLAFQDGYPSAWQRMAEKHPDVTAGSSNLYQSWEVVDPEKWVPHDYVCVRVDSRGAGCSPGFIDHFSPRETKDFLRLHRMGRRAAVVERQGRAQRHFLLRHEPVARGVAAAAASCRHVHLGRRGRLVSRHDASRRHSLDVLGELVRHAGQDRAIRRRRARQTQPRARRAGVRTGNAVGRRTCQKPRRFRRPDRVASARRQISPAIARRTGRR